MLLHLRELFGRISNIHLHYIIICDTFIYFFIFCYIHLHLNIAKYQNVVHKIGAFQLFTWKSWWLTLEYSVKYLLVTLSLSLPFDVINLEFTEMIHLFKPQIHIFTEVPSLTRVITFTGKVY